MKMKIRKSTKLFLAGILSLALVAQAFTGVSFASEEDVHADKVIIPTADTVTVGDGAVYEYNENGGVFDLFSAHADITSIVNVLGNSNGSSFVLNFTEPISVANHNKMTINLFVGGWSETTQTIKAHVYKSGETNLAISNAVGSFETVGNLNKEVTFELDLTKYADASGMVKNLTFLCETVSTVTSWYAFGAFRLSYEEKNTDPNADKVIIPTVNTVTVGDGAVYEYNENGGVFDLFSAYADITSIVNVLGNSNGASFVLNFTEPISVANHNKMTINLFVGGWSETTQTIKAYVYKSDETNLATSNAVGSFETVGNLNKEVTLELDLTKYADASGMVENLTFLCETISTATSWYAFGAFRLTYEETSDTPDVPDTPEEPDVPDEPTYTELTFSDWSTSVGAMEGSNIYSLTGHNDITSLDGVAISGKVNFNGAYWLRVGGTESVKHGGIWFGCHSAGLYMTPQGIGGSGDYFPMLAAEWDALKNTDITLRLTFDRATDGSSWTVGVSINGNENGSYTIAGLNPGLYIGIDSAVTVDMGTGAPDIPDEPDVPDEPDNSKTYTELTFTDWGIMDGEYIAAYAYELTNGLTSLDGTALNGSINFDGNKTWIRIGAPDGWAGLLISGRENSLIIDSEISGFNTLDNTLSYTKKNLLTEEFKLRLTFDYDSDNHVRLGVWIDDEFQKYFAYKEMATAMGTKLLIDTAGVTIADVGTKGEEIDTTPGKKVTLPKNLTEVTFESFGIADGTYKYNGNLLATEGQYARTLGSSMFSGEFYIPSGSNVDFRYGGVSANWFGLIFANTADGKLYMEGIADDVKVTDTYVFNPDKAGVSFIDNWFNLKLTTELVDCDGDGDEDDVKLGVWFNNTLYNNKYMELQDYAQYLGNRVGIYVKDENSSIGLKSDTSVYMGVDFTLFGFTRNWAKELGLK